MATMPKPPKRARTAYLIFCDRYRNQIMKDVHPDPTSKFTREEMQTVTTRLAEMWKNVDPRELEQCRLEAEMCKDEYQKLKDIDFGTAYTFRPLIEEVFIENRGARA